VNRTEAPRPRPSWLSNPAAPIVAAAVERAGEIRYADPAVLGRPVKAVARSIRRYVEGHPDVTAGFRIRAVITHHRGRPQVAVWAERDA
jgi:hypothetical protein